MKKDAVKYLLIALGAALLFIPFLGQAHLFDWDEVNFAECAREMLLTKNYLRVQVDFQPFWEKPPLFIWMQALCMSVFGINEFAARLPNALMGIVTLCTLFYIGKRVVSERMAWWWVLLYAASWLPHFYFKSAIIDPTFNFFIFLSFFQVYLMRYGRKPLLHTVLAGVFLGLAVLTKGPVAILVALLSLVVYLLLNKGFWGYKWAHFLLLIVVCAATTFLWFGVDIVRNGWWFTREFITYQVRLFQTEDAGHGGPFYYHFIILLIGCFPAAAFLFQAGRKSAAVRNTKEESEFARWMWILFWVTLILFSIVKTKIVHYSSLCYFPLSFLAALQLSRIDEAKVKMKKIVTVLLSVTGVLLAIVITLLPLVGLNKDKLIPLFDDDFAVANLQAQVPWSYAECAFGLLYLAGVIVALVWMRRSFRRGMLVLVAVQVLIIQVTVAHFTPKIEAFSQRAAIEYYKSFAGKDVYLRPLGFASYAFLFYSEKQPSQNPEYYKGKNEWLLNGKVDKPVYFITKITDTEWSKDPRLVQIGSKNGFVFYKRKE
ncbi:ArnT family glycosyltransferase [Taibaiella chishuiensis]|uniref:4-amino-4-deoxy-L-arabinose transferase-like glycosyltransferase n=1 Tax=Taibaiella chishuiensis TaxID=1434707 RepID=A0A2P8DCE1_9BACT|nr:glycosyltransferase family 39 protein [Taibaiella chishuiensis]PSK94865.1 4-amino-4-deoxy-L-arabinose transferase-like glycosyltransferase [Taibaiella chishuiensis]